MEGNSRDSNGHGKDGSSDKNKQLDEDDGSRSLHTPSLPDMDEEQGSESSPKKSLKTTIEVVIDEDSRDQTVVKKPRTPVVKPLPGFGSKSFTEPTSQSQAPRKLTAAEQRALKLKQANDALTALLSSTTRKRLPEPSVLAPKPKIYFPTYQPTVNYVNESPMTREQQIACASIMTQDSPTFTPKPRPYNWIKKVSAKSCSAPNCCHSDVQCSIFTRNTVTHKSLEEEKSWRNLLEIIFRKKLGNTEKPSLAFDIHLCCCHFNAKEVHGILSTPEEGHKLFPTNFADGLTPMCYREKLTEGQKTYTRTADRKDHGIPQKLPPTSQWKLPKPKTIKTPLYNLPGIPGQVRGYVAVPTQNMTTRNLKMPSFPPNHIDLLPTHGVVCIRGCTEDAAKKIFEKDSLEEPRYNHPIMYKNMRGELVVDELHKECLIPYCRHNVKMCTMMTQDYAVKNLVKAFLEKHLGVLFVNNLKVINLCACHFKREDVLGVENVMSRYDYSKKAWILYTTEGKTNPWQVIPRSSTSGLPKLRVKENAEPVWDEIAYQGWLARKEVKKFRSEKEVMDKKLTPDQYRLLTGKMKSHEKFSKETLEKACETKFLMSWDAYEHIVNVNHHPFPSVMKLSKFMKDYIVSQEEGAETSSFRTLYGFEVSSLSLDLTKVQESISEFDIISEKRKFDFPELPETPSPSQISNNNDDNAHDFQDALPVIDDEPQKITNENNDSFSVGDNNSITAGNESRIIDEDEEVVKVKIYINN